MMGAGKTTVGRQLAKRLGKTFYDADREIETRTGVRVAVVFDIEGEAGFRKREAEVIEQLTGLNDIVLATGGGAVLDPRNRENLRTRGFVMRESQDPRLRHLPSRACTGTVAAHPRRQVQTAAAGRRPARAA